MTSHKLIDALHMIRCPLSTDGGGTEANHYIKDGACVICDRTPYSLAIQHGLDA